MTTESAPSASEERGKVMSPQPYKGGMGSFMWVLHRVTGVLILFFLFAHVIDTATIMWGPEVYNDVVKLYKNDFVLVAFEIPLVGAVIFHAFNGLRIIAIDLTSWGVRLQKELAYAVFAITAVLFIPSAFMMLRHFWS